LFTLSTNSLEYLPVRDLSYAFDFALWGANPVGFHLTNVCLFALNIIVMYMFTVKLLQLFYDRFSDYSFGDPTTGGLFVAALFAVHPLHGEVVNFVTMRNALLCGVFFFITCHFYLHYLTSVTTRRYWCYAGAFICFVCTVFSKATGIILPLILVIFAFTFRRPNRWSGWLPLFTFLLGSGCAFYLLKHVATVNRIIGQSAINDSELAKIILAVQIPFFYLYKIVVPANYSVDYDITQFGSEITDYRVAGSLLLIVVITTMSWKLRRRMPHVAFCLLWYVMALIPVLHFFQTNPVVADRYAFLPSYPVFMFVFLSQCKMHTRFPIGVMVIAVVALVSLGSASALRNRIWKNDRSLWEYTIQTAPHSAVAHINLARLLFIEENECDKGLEYAKKAQKLYPADTNYDLFQGVLKLRGNDPQGAIIDFKRALGKNDQHMETLVNLATAYQMLGDRDKARDCLRRAINSTEPYAPGDLRETAAKMLQELIGKEP
jgi:hypothetical protein